MTLILNSRRGHLLAMTIHPTHFEDCRPKHPPYINLALTMWTSGIFGNKPIVKNGWELDNQPKK